VERYYNIKIGSKSQSGIVIKVDTSADLEKRVKGFDEADISVAYAGKSRGGYLYTVVLHKDKIIGGGYAPGLAIHEPVGNIRLPDGKNLVKILVTEKGDAKLQGKNKHGRVYISEVKRSEAREHKSEAYSWRKMQAYFFGC